MTSQFFKNTAIVFVWEIAIQSCANMHCFKQRDVRTTVFRLPCESLTCCDGCMVPAQVGASIKTDKTEKGHPVGRPFSYEFIAFAILALRLATKSSSFSIQVRYSSTVLGKGKCSNSPLPIQNLTRE